MFISIIVLVFLGPAPIVSQTKQGYTALSFGRTTGDYIHFRPDDMSPFARSFTLCCWMKRPYTPASNDPAVFQYYPGQILMGTSFSNYVINDFIFLEDNPGRNVWFHHCLSWAPGTGRAYIDGVEVGFGRTGFLVPLGGSITLGNRVQTKGNIYGGELYKLNMFSEQLTPYQIREMANSDMCSGVEEKYETRLLKWEEILTKERHGNVREFVPEECAMLDIDYVKNKLTQTEAELTLTKKTLQNTESRLDSSDSSLQEVSTSLNKALSDMTEIRTQLNETQTDLEEKETKLHETEAKLEEKDTMLQESRNEVQEKENRLLESETEGRRTKKELQEVSITLNGTLSELKDTRAQLNEAQAELEEKDARLLDTQKELKLQGSRLQETVPECSTKLTKAEIELKLTKKTLRNTNRRLDRELDRRERKCGTV